MADQIDRPTWHRSTRCGSSTCIEVARIGNQYLIRDSKDPDAEPLSFTAEEWTAFVHAVKTDEFTF